MPSPLSIDAQLRQPMAVDAVMQPPPNGDVQIRPPLSVATSMRPPSTTTRTRLAQYAGGYILQVSKFGDKHTDEATLAHARISAYPRT
jgi:hypothetical protein